MLRIVAVFLFCIFPGVHLYSQAGNFTERIAGETDIEMILVRGGTFKMGSNDQEQAQPIHSVLLNSFYISKYEITQQQWDATMVGYYNVSHHSNCPQCPVESVSWAEAQQFIRKLTVMTGKSYRLPTEAEWEYAAKGGQSSRHYRYSGNNDIDLVGWIADGPITDETKTKPVGLKQPNELGIYDMSGNVLEMCSDWYDSTYYQNKIMNNPQGPANGKYKVYRGGSYVSYPQPSTVTFRDNNRKLDTVSVWRTLGFRIVRDYNKSDVSNVPAENHQSK